MDAAMHHSSVAQTSHDQRDVGLGGAEACGYLSLRDSAAERSDFGDFVCRQELLVVSNGPDIDRMLAIKMSGHPFQVGNDVIRFDAVNMVDHRVADRVGNEGETDESVDMDGLAFSVSEKVDVLVSKFVGAGSQNLPIDSTGLRSFANTIQASDTTKVTNLVKFSEVFDRYGSPLFRNDDIHTTGCPSGYGGMMIKDPSHAATFGGSGIMPSASDNFNRRLRFR